MSNTKRQIIEAAIIVLTDNLSATMDMISERASVTRRTLHRYFSDRDVLLEACKKEMISSCMEAMNAAYNSSNDPLKQLEQMLYAGIDCNYKYAFLNKMQQRLIPRLITEEEGELVNDNVKAKWHALIIALQGKKIISECFTPHWIFFLFDGMISTTIMAFESGDVAKNEIRNFAWRSFSNSIGIR